MTNSDRRNSTLGFATNAIHHAYDPLQYHGALNPPLFMTSTYTFENADQGSDRFSGDAEGYIYHRAGNPTVDILQKRLALLEGAEAALFTSSGMGAISSAFWSLLKAGDEVVADKILYGCTFDLLQNLLPRFGVKTVFVDMTDPAKVAAVVNNKTRVIYSESPANPNLRLIDIAAIGQISRKNDAVFIIDNTFCTPYLQKPLELGADLVVHSATKYLGGHGDLLAGAAAGRQELIDEMRGVGVSKMTGAMISSFDAFLILRGLKTLHLRMDRHCQSALKLAQMLENHDAVEAVSYPGLQSSPYHELAKRQMSQFGGMIALELKGGMAAGKKLMDALTLVASAVSLGDAETLIQHPASMTHNTYEPEERLSYGITDGLIRISLGLEDYDDIADDFEQALGQL